MTKMKCGSKLTVLRKIGAKWRERGEKQLPAASFRGETFISQAEIWAHVAP